MILCLSSPDQVYHHHQQLSHCLVLQTAGLDGPQHDDGQMLHLIHCYVQCLALTELDHNSSQGCWNPR